MSSFYAVPTGSVYSPFTSSSSIVLEDIVSPISPILPLSTRLGFSNVGFSNIGLSNVTLSNIPKVDLVTGLYTTGTIYDPTKLYYYDSGIGENPLARHETNIDLRYWFLDDWLYKDENQDILKMLKVEGKSVKVLSKNDAEKNDISKDTEDDLERKSDFIGTEILTLGKNKKILDSICRKNPHLKYYDLPHNKKYVARQQAKYIRNKLKEMQK